MEFDRQAEGKIMPNTSYDDLVATRWERAKKMRSQLLSRVDNEVEYQLQAEEKQQLRSELVEQITVAAKAFVASKRFRGVTRDTSHHWYVCIKQRAHFLFVWGEKTGPVWRSCYIGADGVIYHGLDGDDRCSDTLIGWQHSSSRCLSNEELRTILAALT